MAAEPQIEERMLSFFKQEKYRSLLAAAAAQRRQSILVDHSDLISFDEELSHLIVNDPLKYLPILDRAAYKQLQVEDPDYAATLKEFKARVFNLPDRIPIREIRSHHLGKLIAVDGIMVRASTVRPMLKTAVFACSNPNCGAKYVSSEDSSMRLKPPERCERCRGRKFEMIAEESEYIDFQLVGIQEKPEDLPPGQIPRVIDVELKGDIVDVARPGDRVIVTGILRTMPERDANTLRRTSKMYLDAVSIETASKEPESLIITPEEERLFREMAKDPEIHKKLIDSIAPSLYGLEHVKKAVMLLLFGGRPKQYPDGTRIRGDIHLLLVGDPGTGKSQLLKYVAMMAPRGVYTSGRGSTAAGLTAAVVRDATGGMMLEAGALVLADMGVACIDEIDKMRPEDRVALHEAMAQQSYHRDFELLTYNYGKVKIGELVDMLIRKNPDRLIKLDDCEVLEIPPEVMLYTLDPKSLKVEICIPVRVSRHKAPEKFVKISYSNGREIIVTPEHPVYVWRDGKIITIRADEVKVGEFAPSIRFLPNSNLPQRLKTVQATDKREKQIILPSKLTEPLARLLGYLASEGHFYAGRTYEVGFSSKDPSLINEVRSLFAQLFGMEPTISINKYGVVTLRYLSKMLYDFFRENFPEIVETASKKRVPKQILCGSAEVGKEFLRGLFLGDGSIDSYSATLKSSSKALIEDCQDLLLKLGICSSISRGKDGYYRLRILSHSLETFLKEVIPEWSPLYNKGIKLLEKSRRVNRSHDILPPDIGRTLRELIRSVGLTYHGQFNEHLKGNYGITKQTIKKEIEMIEQRLRDVLRGIKAARDLRELRNLIGYSQGRLASLVGISRSMIDYAERGGYSIEKREKLLEDARQAVMKVLEEVEGKLNELKTLLNSDLSFLRVKRVEILENKGDIATEWVYDVTVEPTHSFISHGLLLHNTISIAKGGIVATLNARTSILAAANPTLGRYDPYRSFTDNVDLPITILSRFDLIFVLRDEPNRELDERLTDHVLGLQSRSVAVTSPPIKPEILRKYIAYAKRIQPELTPAAARLIKEFYLQMRSMYQQTSTVTITARQLESLIRLAEARARAALRDYVTEEDVLDVISLMKRSLSEVGIDVETGRPDIDVILTGKPKSLRDKIAIFLDTLRELQEEKGHAEDEELREALREKGLTDAEISKILNRLLSEGKIFSPKTGVYRIT